MFIIIDGPDFRAKKYLLETFSMLLKLPVVNPNNTKDVKNKHYYLNLIDKSSDVVFDTFHHFEVVHSRLRNYTCGLGESDCKEIEQKIINNNVTSIYVTQKHRQLILNKNLDPSCMLSDYELLLSANAYEMLHEKHKFSTKIELCPNIWRPR